VRGRFHPLTSQECRFGDVKGCPHGLTAQRLQVQTLLPLPISYVRGATGHEARRKRRVFRLRALDSPS
jgi:hypothetical protein